MMVDVLQGLPIANATICSLRATPIIGKCPDLRRRASWPSTPSSPKHRGNLLGNVTHARIRRVRDEKSFKGYI